jgi:hypothetical protein
MADDIDRLKSLIKYKLINLKESVLDILNGKIDLKISLSDEDFRFLEKEAQKINITRSELIRYIDEVRAGINFAPETRSMFKIIPADVPLGQHIRLVTNDERGEAIEEFIYIGDNQFVLVNHERNSLMLTDVLVPRTSPWNVGGFIDFEVYRNNVRVIVNGKLSIYRTRKIKQMLYLIPQIDYDKLLLNDEEFKKLSEADK